MLFCYLQLSSHNQTTIQIDELLNFKAKKPEVLINLSNKLLDRKPC